jgi:hypothetical protein
MYVLLDGFDLGIGILFLTGAQEQERDAMMNSIAPYWDGNETWLVLGGAGLLVAFPMAYAIVMPALYLPLIIMLLALVFRAWLSSSVSCPSQGIAGGTGPSRWAPRLRPSARASCLAVSCKAST